MNTISTKALAAVLLTAVGLSAAVPAMAQEAPPSPETAATQPENGPEGRPFHRPGEGPRRMGGEGGLLDFARGGEAIEIALVRLSHRIDLTSEQQGLLDTLKTTALAAADDFTTATEGLMPKPPVEGEAPAMPDISERLENRIAMEKAHVAALEAVQPAMVAFFDSLTDDQKAELMPQPGEDGGPRGPHRGGPHHGPRPGFGG